MTLIIRKKIFDVKEKEEGEIDCKEKERWCEQNVKEILQEFMNE